MSIEVLKTTWKSPLALVAAAALLAASGCTTTAPTNTASPAAPAANATPAGGASTAAANLPVTLPVLDAMFADEAFAGELKSKLQLTDEQVESLRKVAGEERAGLDEAGGGTTAAATRRASEKIQSVI